MKKPMLLWGASGHALVVSEIVDALGEFAIVGFIEDPTREPGRGETPRMLASQGRIVGDRTVLGEQFTIGVRHMIMAFGNCSARLQMAVIAQRHGYAFPTAIHPASVISPSAQIGAGTVICAGAVVGPGVVIGEHAVINTCSSVDHECVIGDGVHIGPGARLAGRVTVGRAAWIGIGASVRDRVNIGTGAIVGIGAAVVKDVFDDRVVAGVPAVVIRSVREAEN